MLDIYNKWCYNTYRMKHGLHSTYTNNNCRCRPCRDAQAAYQRIVRLRGPGYIRIKKPRNRAICHPDQVNHSRGLCRKCYNKAESTLLNKRLRTQRSRQRLIDILGGCCNVCGYSKNIAALDFHHIDPSTKRKQCRDWQRSDFDVSTVILLCRNCHAEIENPNLELNKQINLLLELSSKEKEVIL
jgi:hypothetical protein